MMRLVSAWPIMIFATFFFTTPAVANSFTVSVLANVAARNALLGYGGDPSCTDIRSANPSSGAPVSAGVTSSASCAASNGSSAGRALAQAAASADGSLLRAAATASASGNSVFDDGYSLATAYGESRASANDDFIITGSGLFALVYSVSGTVSAGVCGGGEATIGASEFRIDYPARIPNRGLRRK